MLLWSKPRRLCFQTPCSVTLSNAVNVANRSFHLHLAGKPIANELALALPLDLLLALSTDPEHWHCGNISGRETLSYFHLGIKLQISK